MIVPMCQEESNFDIRYVMWWPQWQPEWLVIAHELIAPDGVVSVQFKPQSRKRHIPNPAPGPTVNERELEVA